MGSLSLRLRCALEDVKLRLSLILGLARLSLQEAVVFVVFEICHCWTAIIPTLKSFEDEASCFVVLFLTCCLLFLNWYVMVEDVFLSYHKNSMSLSITGGHCHLGCPDSQTTSAFEPFKAKSA